MSVRCALGKINWRLLIAAAVCGAMTSCATRGALRPPARRHLVTYESHQPTASMVTENFNVLLQSAPKAIAGSSSSGTGSTPLLYTLFRSSDHVVHFIFPES